MWEPAPVFSIASFLLIGAYNLGQYYKLYMLIQPLGQKIRDTILGAEMNAKVSHVSLHNSYSLTSGKVRTIQGRPC